MQNQYGYGWNLLEKPIKFSINANTTSLSLTELPPIARKVKLYLSLQSGTCQETSRVTWSFFTKVDIIKISGIPHNENAYEVQSADCPLILDERKIIQVSRSGNFPGVNFTLYVEVLGYK